MTAKGLGAVLTAIVTPFDDDLNVDEDAFVDLLHHLAAARFGRFRGLRHHRRGVHPDRRGASAGHRAGGPGAPDRQHIIAGTGSNNTRHAVHLTERATELGADAVLSVTPYYNRPNRRGILAHFGEVARATDKPIVLYNVPSRVVIDLPDDLLAELAQLDNVAYVKQANNASLALVDGLGLYAGNDDGFLATLELGGCGGILVASHLVGEQLRRMVDEPEHRAEIDASLRDVYAAMGITTNPIPVKAALALAGHRVGGLRLPLVEASDEERAQLRDVLERHGLVAA